MTPTPFTRATVPDPATNRALQDVYDKLAQLQSGQTTAATPAKADTPTVSKGVWTLLTNSDLFTGWTNKLGTDYQASYQVSGKAVYLRGAITGGTITEGTVIFTLPVDARPKLRLTAAVLGSTGAAGFAAGLIFEPKGDVKISGVTNNNTLHLDCQIYLSD